jgi:hypothetical protein
MGDGVRPLSARCGRIYDAVRFYPNRLLRHDSPAARIREGDFRSVLAVLDALADGIVV